MKKILPLFVVMLLCASLQAVAQMFTASPSPLQESSKDVVITFHADQSGVSGLKNLSSSTALYAHIGVFTNGETVWKYVKTDWPTSATDTKANTSANKFTYTAADTYTLNIGDIRTYFGITDASEKVTNICIIARTADGKAQTSDQFIEVAEAGFQLQLSHNAESTILSQATSVTFNVNTTEASTINLTVNGSSIKQATSAKTLTATYSFNKVGSYEVVASANNGKETITETVGFIYINASEQATYPGGKPKMGAVENSDGSVTFCIAAPGKKSVILIPSWDDYKTLDKNVMKYQDYNGNRYFWTTVTGLDPDKQYPYYYAVDGTCFVGDPYAKLILDPYSDKWINQYETIYPDLIPYPYDKGIDGIVLGVYHGNINKYNWKIKDFKGAKKEELVIYELLLRDFTGDDGEANGNGTLKKALEKLDYLKKLGVNAIELMPIQEFNGNNSWGYNTNFYFAPDKAYGTPDDYKLFIDRCHEAGIAVILDVVFNQSDGLHPWYQMYPIDSNPFYNKTAPHDYSVLNDWKQDNPLVEQQWVDMLQYWLTEYKVDGFRFDLVKGLGDNNSYGSGTEAYNQSRIDRMKRLHAAIKEVNPDAYHINEHLAGASEENPMGADGQMNWANVNYNSCQFAMGFSSSSDLNRFNAANDSRTWGSTVSYIESHDEERAAYKQNQYGASGVKGNLEMSMRRLGSLAAQMLLSPGAHMIWQFGELGADETTKKTTGENNTDPKKVVWNYLEDNDRAGLLQSYIELIALRKDNPQFFTSNTATMGLDASWSNGSTIKLVSGSQELILAVNPLTSGTSGRNITLPLNSSNTSDYKILSCSYNTTPTLTGKQIKLLPGAYAVIGSVGLTKIEDAIADNTKVVVRGEVGRIVIEGEYENAEVYSVSGMLQGGLEVPAGVYLVRVDGNVTKVVVR